MQGYGKEPQITMIILNFDIRPNYKNINLEYILKREVSII